MRALGVLLIVLSLALGVGGVAKRPLADEAASSGVCKPSDPSPPRSVSIEDDGSAEGEGEVISLNTRGYNHRRPGEVETILPDVTGTKRPAQLAEPASE